MRSEAMRDEVVTAVAQVRRGWIDISTGCGGVCFVGEETVKVCGCMCGNSSVSGFASVSDVETEGDARDR